MVLTKRELESAQCEAPGCDHKDHDELTLTPRCHPGRGLTATYSREKGVMVLACVTCRNQVASLAIAP